MPEIGEKLIGLVVQMLIRHLNFVIDKINEKKSMSPDYILFILEDLHAMQSVLHGNIASTLCARLAEINPTADTLGLVSKLVLELDSRINQMTKPCIEAIGKRVEQKLVENFQAFRQIPSKVKIDPIVSNPS